MCLDILKTPVKAIASAKKKKDINYTLKVLVEAGVFVGLAAILLVTKNPLISPVIIVSTFIVALLLTVAVGLFFGLLANIIAQNLGGKGNYFAGLTSVTYAIVGPAVGIFIASILLYIPVVGFVISYIVLALMLAYGLSTLYRSYKDLYSLDMITTFVAISIITLTIVMSTLLLGANASFLSMFNTVGMIGF